MIKTSRNVGVLLLVFSSAILLTACDGQKGNPADGKRWFTMNNCSACHGLNGNDGRAAHISAIDMSFGSFVRFIRNPDSPSMPKFSENKVSKEDAADIYAWLKSMPE